MWRVVNLQWWLVYFSPGREPLSDSTSIRCKGMLVFKQGIIGAGLAVWGDALIWLLLFVLTILLYYDFKRRKQKFSTSAAHQKLVVLKKGMGEIVTVQETVGGLIWVIASQLQRTCLKTQ